MDTPHVEEVKCVCGYSNQVHTNVALQLGQVWICGKCGKVLQNVGWERVSRFAFEQFRHPTDGDVTRAHSLGVKLKEDSE